MSPLLGSGLATRKAGDLLPLSCKGAFVGTPPTQHAFSLLLLLVQGGETCEWIGDAPLDRTQFRCALFHRKDSNWRGKSSPTHSSLGTQEAIRRCRAHTSSWLRHSSVTCRCPCRSRASIKVGRNGIKRVAQMRLAAFQA